MTGPLILIGYDRSRSSDSPWFVLSRRRDGTEYGLVYHGTLAVALRTVEIKVARGDLGLAREDAKLHTASCRERELEPGLDTRLEKL